MRGNNFNVVGLMGAVAICVSWLPSSVHAEGFWSDGTVVEDHRNVPMPAGFRVEHSELDGPVFADESGKTLYYWPQTTMRNGLTGDPKNQSMCTFEKTTHTAGLMSPYPPGLELPELDKRLSCAEVWPPAFAPDDAHPVGAFTLIERKDGSKQWAYDGHALYTSIMDEFPGDVRAATTRTTGGDGPAARKVAAVPPNIPPGFGVISTAMGRQIVTSDNWSVYAFEGDEAGVSNCRGECTETWDPVVAPASARDFGEWSVFERSPGIHQWAFRGQPLYTHVMDSAIKSLEGSDIAGWANVFTQKAPAPPPSFTLQDSPTGVVLADSRGMTIYTYNCADDSVDQLACDFPNTPQAYRLAICGGGKVDRCLHDWPYVVAAEDEVSTNRTWTILEIDPKTGHFAEPGQEDALRVWAYLGSPVYTHYRDKRPGDMIGHANGEFGGSPNGFKTFILRDDFYNNAG